MPADSWVWGNDGGDAAESIGRRLELLPNGLLWEPQLADKSQPRLSAVFHNADSFFSRQTADPSIGLTVGLGRFQPTSRSDLAVQVDLFAVAHLRYSRVDESIAQNYRAGIPITWRAGNWVGKFGYEHTSTQLGDELFESGRRGRITFERDEVVGALGYLWRDQLRPYGQVGCAIYRNIPGDPSRWRYDVGFDWYRRQDSGPLGQPFAAVNAAFDPAVDYDATMTYQVGWMWKKLNQRLGQVRVYAEFYDGHSIFGQLFNTRERYAGFGIVGSSFFGSSFLGSSFFGSSFLGSSFFGSAGLAVPAVLGLVPPLGVVGPQPTTVRPAMNASRANSFVRMVCVSGCGDLIRPPLSQPAVSAL